MKKTVRMKVTVGNLCDDTILL